MGSANSRNAETGKILHVFIPFCLFSMLEFLCINVSWTLTIMRSSEKYDVHVHRKKSSVWYSYSRGYVIVYNEKSALLKKGCFIGPQNQRFRLKEGCFFFLNFVRNPRKLFSSLGKSAVGSGMYILSWCWSNFLTPANQIAQIWSCDRSRIHVSDLGGTGVWPGKMALIKRVKTWIILLNI